MTGSVLMIEHLRRLFEYESWANRRTLESLKSVAAPRRALHRFAHLLAAQRMWLARIRGEDTAAIGVWGETPLEGCAAKLEELDAELRSFVDGLDESGLERRVTYHNTQGREFHNSVLDILTHLSLHSHYHRGQIAARVREAGGEPAQTDYIFYVRQKGA